MSLTLTTLTQETPEYIKRFLGKLGTNLDAINNIYANYKVMLINIETNIKIENTQDTSKYTRLLKIIKNILERGYIYHLYLITNENETTILVKSHFKRIDKTYTLELTQNISKNEAKITMNEIDETNFSPLYPQVYQLGYYVFKNDSKINLSSFINFDLPLWKSNGSSLEILLYYMSFSNLLKKRVDGSLKEYYKNIDLDTDNKIIINMCIKDTFKDFSDNICNIKNKHLILYKKIRDHLTIIALLIEINGKYYYFSYSFKEKTKHNYNELQTICIKTQRYKLFEFDSLEDIGFIRTKSFYKFLNNIIDDTSTYLNMIYYDLLKTLNIMEHFENAGVKEDDNLID